MAPFVAFPDFFASTSVNSQFTQGLVSPGWDQMPDPFVSGYGQLPNPNIGGPFDPNGNYGALPDPNAGGPFAASQDDELNALQNQLDDLQNSIQSLGSLF